MLIKQYGVTLRRVEKRDIELIRKSRNSDAIRKKMLYQDYISKKMQLNWFKSIEKDGNSVYFIIIQKQKKIGLINAKNSCKNKEFSESGIFLFSPEYYNTNISVIASLIMLSSSFYALNCKYSIIRVLKTNTKALKYNNELGYTIIDKDNNFYILENTKDKYEKKTKNIRKAITNLYGNSQLEFIAEPIDFELGLKKSIYNDMANIPKEIILKKVEKNKYLKIILNL